jgi:hypothetical protein
LGHSVDEILWLTLILRKQKTGLAPYAGTATHRLDFAVVNLASLLVPYDPSQTILHPFKSSIFCHKGQFPKRCCQNKPTLIELDLFAHDEASIEHLYHC